MAWRQIGDKPLSESMLTIHGCIYVAVGGEELNNHVDLNETMVTILTTSL